MVPQKVWVTVPSWMDSLHRPKSVNFTWPGQNQSKNIREATLQTNKRLRITLPRERSHSGIKVSYVDGRVSTSTICLLWGTLQVLYHCYWAWCSQASGLYRWCLSGAGDPEPWRSQPGRNCRHKQTTQVKSVFITSDCSCIYGFCFPLAIFSIHPASLCSAVTVLFWLQHTPLCVQQLASHNHHSHLQAVFRKQTNVCRKSLSLFTYLPVSTRANAPDLKMPCMRINVHFEYVRP